MTDSAVTCMCKKPCLAIVTTMIEKLRNLIGFCLGFDVRGGGGGGREGRGMGGGGGTHCWTTDSLNVPESIVSRGGLLQLILSIAWCQFVRLTSVGNTTGVTVGEVRGLGMGGRLTGVIFWVLLGLFPACPGFAPSTWLN